MPDGKSIGQIVLGGLFGAAVAALISGMFNLRLEQEKFRTSLVLKALEADNEQDRADRLLFMLNLELISDSALSGKLKTLAAKVSTSRASTASAAATLPQFEAPAPAAAPAAPVGLPPRIYLAAGTSSLATARGLKGTLEDLGYVVSLTIRSNASARQATTVAYYYSEDEREARDLVELLRTLGAANVTPEPRRLSGTARRRHYDVNLSVGGG